MTAFRGQQNKLLRLITTDAVFDETMTYLQHDLRRPRAFSANLANSGQLIKFRLIRGLFLGFCVSPIQLKTNKRTALQCGEWIFSSKHLDR